MRNKTWRRIPWAGWPLGVCLAGLVVLSAGCRKSASDQDSKPTPKYEVADDTPSGDSVQQPSGRSPLTPDAEPATGGQPVPGRQGTELATDGRAPAASGGMPSVDGGLPAGDGLSQPPSVPGDQLNTLTVPQGTPEELLSFIERLGNQLVRMQRQGGASPAAVQPILEKMLEASEKALAANPDDTTRKQAIEAKAGVLIALSQLSPNPKWKDKIHELAQTMAADKSPATAIEGRTMLLGMLAGEVLQGRSQDVEGLMAQMRALLADELRDLSVLTVAQQVIMVLEQTNQTEQAREALKLTAEAFKDHADPQVAAEAEGMFEQILLNDLQVDAKLNDVSDKREGAVVAFTDAVTQILQRPKPGAFVLARVSKWVAALELSGNYELVSKVCALVAAAYQNSAVPEHREYAKQYTDATMRRLGLLGKPLTLEGTLVDGTPLDFTRYQAKTVLLVFWSTGAAPCRPELQRIKSMYEKYNPQGLEVIGVCLDQDSSLVTQFLAETKLPWATVLGTRKLAEQFGIDRIPYLMLTDRQGNVADMFGAGLDLDAKLAQLFGTASTPPPVTSGP